MILDTFVKTVISKIEFWIVLAFAALVFICIHLYQQNANIKLELTLMNSKTHQNELAWQDSTCRQAGKVTILAAFVRDLQDKISRSNKEVVIWKDNYKHVIDSVHAHGNTIAVDGRDSIGAYKKVTFFGKQSIATYEGAVKVYLTPLSKAIWILTIGFDNINTAAEFNRDKNGMFFIRTTSLTPGVNVIGYTTLDSAAYPYLYSMNNKVIEKSLYTLYGGGLIDKQVVSLGIGLRASEWLILFNYKLFKSIVLQSNSWQDNVQVGVYYGLF